MRKNRKGPSFSATITTGISPIRISAIRRICPSRYQSISRFGSCCSLPCPSLINTFRSQRRTSHVGGAIIEIAHADHIWKAVSVQIQDQKPRIGENWLVTGNATLEKTVAPVVKDSGPQSLTE